MLVAVVAVLVLEIQGLEKPSFGVARFLLEKGGQERLQFFPVLFLDELGGLPCREFRLKDLLAVIVGRKGGQLVVTEIQVDVSVGVNGRMLNRLGEVEMP